MRILALDSTALTATVALCEDEKLLSEYTLNNGNTHSETILPMISSMLDLFGCTVSDIDVFACSAGPGSFTGVRIGAATLKGLAFGREKPCVGVSTLEALAYNVKGCDGIICAVMNARRGQVYNALFSSDGERLCEDRALSIEELCAELIEKHTKVVVCGDGTDITIEGFKGRVNATAAPNRLVCQSAYSVAQVALRYVREGRTVTDIELTPVYLRLSQAERERLARESGSLENNEKIKGVNIQ